MAGYFRETCMRSKKRQSSSLIALFVIASFVVNTTPVAAQDIVNTQDVTSGSSVFVFRKSSKAPQVRSSSKSKTTGQRNVAQKKETRKKIREQVAVVRKEKPRPRNTATNPKTPPPTNTNTPKTVSKVEASKTFASAGEIYLDQNNLDKAVEFFKKSAELDPKNASAKLGLSEAYTLKGDQVLDTGNAETSAFYYEEAVKANPNNSAAHAGLGEVFDAAGKNDRALTSYERALALDPTLTELFAPLGILYFQKGEIAKAEDYLTKIQAVNPDDSEVQYFYGLILTKQNRDADAINAFKRSIAKIPTAEAHLYLGEAYDRMNNDRAAMSEYQNAINLNPRFAEAYYNLGVAKYNREKYMEAIVDYKEAIKLKNDYADAHANLAETYRQLGTDEKDPKKKRDWFGLAIGSYQLATTFIKDDPELYSAYGYTLGRLGNWNQAIDTLQKAVTPRADAVDYTNLGWAYYNAAQEDIRMKQDAASRVKLASARTALEKAVSLNKNFEAAYLNLGITQTDLGDFAGSIASLENAIRLRKNWVPALNELGIAFFKTNKFAEAADQFERATKIDEKFVPALFMLARSEFARGRNKEAKKAQDKLRKLNPNLAKQLDVIFSGAVMNEVQNKVDSEIQKKNPLNKIPRPRFP